MYPISICLDVSLMVVIHFALLISLDLMLLIAGAELTGALFTACVMACDAFVSLFALSFIAISISVSALLCRSNAALTVAIALA